MVGIQNVQIGNLREEKDEVTLVSRAVSQRDMATQMSPKESRRRSSFSPSRPALVPLAEQQSDHSDKSEVKDVEVDKRATMIRWSKRRGMGFNKKGPPDVKDFNENPDQVRTSSFNIAEAAMDISKCVFVLDSITLFSHAFFLEHVNVLLGKIVEILIMEFHMAQVGLKTVVPNHNPLFTSFIFPHFSLC